MQSFPAESCQRSAVLNASAYPDSSSPVRDRTEGFAPVKVRAHTSAAAVTTASRATPMVRRFSAMRVTRSFNSRFPAVMVVAESMGLSGFRATGISRSSVRP